MKERDNIKKRHIREFIFTVAAIVLATLLFSRIQFRIDLTEDKRYTLSKPTREILRQVDNDLFVQVYLEGDMPIPLKRLRRSVKNILDEFRIASNKKIDYKFINPTDIKDTDQRNALFMSLYNKGLNPINVQVNDGEGGKSTKMIFPGMLVNYDGIEIPVNILKNSWLVSYEDNIRHSIEGLEYEIAQTIATITADSIYKIAFIEGHAELYEAEVADITYNLSKYFTVDRGSIGGVPGILDDYSAIIIADPLIAFNEADKLIIDQYIMNGGKALWIAEEVRVSADTLAQGETLAMYRPLNIEDQLFRYGVRINPEIVQDLECQIIQIAVSTSSEQQQLISTGWVYNPLLVPSIDHPITRNINRVKGEFVNTIDTVGLDPAIKKTILLTTSTNSRTITPPVMIRLSEADDVIDRNSFNRSNIPVAVLLEGVFQSAFKNRMTGTIIDDPSFKAITESKPTKMIVVADGDIIRNDLDYSSGTVTPYPLGQDQYTGEIMGNRDFIVNCVNYLVDDNGLMELRSREIKSRLLNKTKINQERLKWQSINIIGPLAIVLFAGILYNFARRRRYAGITDNQKSGN
ncbi:MAG TPA: gliding motility-associated ABC transporter substrate-binding protein GldG [Bacteroidetes bacterium]|nr:gliding motility-associated ABC transporter substrate-binding protein GldG [Bacteroidota bacterium]